MSTYILYNALAGNSTCEDTAKQLAEQLKNEQPVLRSVTDIGSYAEFFRGLAAEDKVILCGGDGTLNRFVNDIGDIEINNQLLYYAAGSGNDFLHDIGGEKGKAVAINEYIKGLPEVTVNGKTSRFINAVGFGIDGYCCEVGDLLRKKQSGKPVNYTGIAIKGVLFGFKPANATVTVDGEERSYKRVWIAPTMHGRFYGGGMNAAPAQSRTNSEGKASLVVWHGSNKLKTLMIFPSIFEGKHVSHTECIDILEGQDISVRFDRPCALQIDGETVLGVTEYRVKSSARVKSERRETATV